MLRSYLWQALQAGLLDELVGQHAAHVVVRVLAKHVHLVHRRPVGAHEGVLDILELDGVRRVVIQLVEEVRDEGESIVGLLLGYTNVHHTRKSSIVEKLK